MTNIDDDEVVPEQLSPDPELEGDGAADALDCRTVDDFYTSRARDTIGRCCRRLLDENVLTPSELLHSPRHQQTVSNSATFASVLTRVDRTMGRKGALNPLVNDLAKRTRELLKASSPPELTSDGVGTALRGLLDGPGDNAVFFAEAAITQTIQVGRSFSEKARLLLALVAATEDVDATGLLDRFLGEIARGEAGFASIMGDIPFAAAVDLVVSLIVGDKPVPEGAPEVFRAIEGALKRSAMPATRESLLIAFRRLMLRDEHFAIAGQGDLFGVETLQREIMELARVASRMRSPDGSFAGGTKTEISIERRAALLINEDSLHEIIRGRNFIHKLRTLFMLQKMPLPAVSRDSVSGYLRQFFSGRDFAPRLLDCWKDSSDKLKGLAEVQRLVNASALTENERHELVRRMDDVQALFMRTFHVLTHLVGKTEPTPDHVMEILRLAADDAFCEGKSRQAAARALYRQVHRPRFISAFLRAAGDNRSQRVAWLRDTMGKLGVPFLDFTALRALVVDDESGPRAFVKSALRDMGIGIVDEAVDGQDAIERMDRDVAVYGLVVCDWMMPRKAGIDVLRWVRVRRPEMPFLMVTALATPKAVHLAIENQVSGYIAKPFTPEQLEDKVFLALMGPKAREG